MRKSGMNTTTFIHVGASLIPVTTLLKKFVPSFKVFSVTVSGVVGVAENASVSIQFFANLTSKLSLFSLNGILSIFCSSSPSST